MTTDRDKGRVNDAVGRPACLMILRLWIEPGGRMRVRITRTVDVGSEESATTYASTRAEVVELVEDWLDSLVTPR